MDFGFHQLTVFGFNEETDGSLGVVNFGFYSGNKIYDEGTNEYYSGNTLRLKVEISTFSAEFDDPSRFFWVMFLKLCSHGNGLHQSLLSTIYI